MKLNPSIFFDLDNTLIFSDYYPHLNSVPVGFGYHTALRPMAPTMLKDARKIAPVYILTAATLKYALAINKKFGLGFTEKMILHREMYMEDTFSGFVLSVPGGICPNGVLIDNNLPHERAAFVKRKFLGLASDDQYFPVSSFGQETDIMAKEWPPIVSHIKQHFTDKKTRRKYDKK